MHNPEDSKRLTVPFHTLSKHKPKHLSEAPDVKSHPPAHPQIMSSGEIFQYYLERSSEIRDMHGVERKNGIWSVTNLDRVKSLPEWKKEILRELVRKK